MVSIISLLSSIVLTSLNSAKAKARDSVRAHSATQIKLALDMFYNEYGCLPTTTSTSCAGAGGYSQLDQGGWDYGSQPTGSPSFMSFLTSAGYLPNMIFDPINNMTGDGANGGNVAYSFRYYCYPNGPHLGYWKESGLYVYVLSLIHISEPTRPY